MTKWRKEVLKIIQKSDKPLNAEDIYRLVEHKPNFSTIYRALNYLEKAEFVKSISFGNTPKYYYSNNEHRHFLYCLKCGKIETFDLCMAQELENKVKKNFMFEIFDHIFYFKGLCKNCSERR
ncbi:transcriptional repressor [Thermosipho ferrireducens]|uniref:Transcriptional repressor n=2 Tax=Thermosipho ferrireducens TaxID=2571116 RepID=A0ABX7S8C5_9BACT|nr:transcriptional repressor [Thermosipho ferrireducens]